MNKLILYIFLLLGLGVKAQNLVIHGWVKDSLGNPLARATVTLYNAYLDSAGISQPTTTTGEFTYSNLGSSKYNLEITFMGFERYFREIEITNQNIDLGTITLSAMVSRTSEVKILVNQGVKIKDDTIQYRADSFKTNPDATAEDLVKKMPGIAVENGIVKAQGEEVKKVTVDGKTYFGEDANIALKNISADMIDRVDVFDQWSDQAMFTGFDDGNSSKSMNIVTKQKYKQGYSGKLYGGYGTEGHYSLGGSYNFFKKERRISLLGLANNINQQNFSSEDISAATGVAVSQGMGRRSAPNPFLMGTQLGITASNSFGLNYSDVWGKKVKFTGSYFFNQSSNKNNQTLLRTFYSSNSSNLFYKEDGNYTAVNFNHRINLKLEYSIDTLNSLLVTPVLSFQNNDYSNVINGGNYHLDTLLNSSSNNNSSFIASYRISNDVLYRHRFHKKGRTFSTSLKGEWNGKNQLGNLKAINQYQSDLSIDTLDQSSSQIIPAQSYAANIIYTEPLGTSAQIMFNVKEIYSLNVSQIETKRYNVLMQSYSVLDSALSSEFKNSFLTHQGGIGIRLLPKKGVNIILGVEYQKVNMQNQMQFPLNSTITKSFESILPNAMIKMKLSAKSNVRLNFRTNVNLPGTMQLQEVWNNSNPLLLSIGNASLKSQYVQSMNIKWMYADAAKAKTMMLFAMASKTSDYIANATNILSADSTLFDGRIIKKGTRYTHPLNLGNYWNGRSYFMYGFPFKRIKSNINLTAGYSFSLAPSLLDGKEGSTLTSTYMGTLTLSSNISEKIDFSLSSSTNYNLVSNSLQSALNNNYLNIQSTFKFNYIFWKGVILQSELNHVLFTGLNTFNRSFFLWNLAVGKKFFKDENGEIRLSVFDVLRENNSVSRSVNEYYLDDIKNVVLQRYFMATFTYKFKKFKSSEKEEVK